MKYYLATMFALPLLQLWERFVASRTVDLQQGYCWEIGDRHFGWAIARGAWSGCANDVVRVFWIRVPFARNWGQVYYINSDTAALGWREAQILRISYSRGVEWKFDWVPSPAPPA